MELPLNAQTHGLVAPESYEIPTVSPLWTPMAYAAFDNSKLDEKVKKNISGLSGFKMTSLGEEGQGQEGGEGGAEASEGGPHS